MAGIDIPVSILGKGIVVLPLKEYEELKQSTNYFRELLDNKEKQLDAAKAEVESLRCDLESHNELITQHFKAFKAIKFSAQEILGGSASCAYVPTAASRIVKACDENLGGAEC